MPCAMVGGTYFTSSPLVWEAMLLCVGVRLSMSAKRQGGEGWERRWVNEGKERLDLCDSLYAGGKECSMGRFFY